MTYQGCAFEIDCTAHGYSYGTLLKGSVQKCNVDHSYDESFKAVYSFKVKSCSASPDTMQL